MLKGNSFSTPTPTTFIASLFPSSGLIPARVPGEAVWEVWPWALLHVQEYDKNDLHQFTLAYLTCMTPEIVYSYLPRRGYNFIPNLRSRHNSPSYHMPDHSLPVDPENGCGACMTGKCLREVQMRRPGILQSLLYSFLCSGITLFSLLFQAG